VAASPPPRSSFWRAFVRRYVIALGVAFVLVVSGIVYGNWEIGQKLDDVHRIKVDVGAEGPAEAGNYLIVGSDTREFVQDEGQRQAFGDPEVETGQRSDTLMVLHLDPAQKKSLLVSFPRDLEVDIPGEGESKINAAFNEGPNRVIETFRDNFDIEIAHYVEVRFDAFPRIVDAIGKVPVYFDAAYRDKFSGLNIPGAGCVELDGQAALGYVRSRHLERYDPEEGEWDDASGAADLDRIGRQQAFIRKLAALAASKTSSNPLKAYDLADAIVPQLKVDAELSNDDILRLVKVFRNVDPNSSESLEMVTIPTEQVGGSYDLRLRQPDAGQLLARLRTFGDQGASAEDVAKVRPAQVKVRVLNGTGEDGAAGRALAELQRFGFAPADVGNSEIIEHTEVHYAPGAEAKAALVQFYLGGAGVLSEDSDLTGADVAVVLGGNYAGVSKPGAKKASTTTSSVPAGGSSPEAGGAQGGKKQSKKPAAPTC
jgi:LCP family protein required for cell wall assembly